MATGEPEFLCRASLSISKGEKFWYGRGFNDCHVTKISNMAWSAHPQNIEKLFKKLLRAPGRYISEFKSLFNTCVLLNKSGN